MFLRDGSGSTRGALASRLARLTRKVERLEQAQVTATGVDVNTLMVARGDLLVGTATAGTVTRKAVGANGRVLTATGSGVAWDAPDGIDWGATGGAWACDYTGGDTGGAIVTATLTAQLDPGGMLSGSDPTAIVIPSSGLWLVTASSCWQRDDTTSTPSAFQGIWIARNGSRETNRGIGRGMDRRHAQAVRLGQLAAGDLVRLEFFLGDGLLPPSPSDGTLMLRLNAARLGEGVAE